MLQAIDGSGPSKGAQKFLAHLVSTAMDPRFARLHTDPRFVRPKASKNQLVVDERFKEFFDDSDREPSLPLSTRCLR